MHCSARMRAARGWAPALVATSYARVRMGASPGRIALQQVRNTFGVQHGRPVRAGRAQPIPGDLRVHVASQPHRRGTRSHGGRRACPPSCFRREEFPSERRVLPRRPSARLRPAGLGERRSKNRARRSRRSVRRTLRPEATPSSAAPSPRARQPRRAAPGPGEDGPPGRSLLPPWHDRSQSQAWHSPRTRQPPGNGDPGPDRAPVAGVPKAAAPGAGGDSGTIHGGGRAGPPADSRSPSVQGHGRIPSEPGPHRRGIRTSCPAPKCG